MPTQTSTMVGVVQAMRFLQLFGVSLSSRLLAGGFELKDFYHGLRARAIRTFSDPLYAPLTLVRPSTVSKSPVASKLIRKIEADANGSAASPRRSWR